ncbi:hypothetical protein OROGR_022297 [Orobanche gracilis]
MFHRSFVYLHRLVCRHHFRRSTQRVSPVQTKSLNIFLNEFSSRPNFPKPHHLHSSKIAKSPRDFKILQYFRHYGVETDKVVDKINLKFVEAREEIESAMESKETVYFNEEAECARSAVGEVLEMYECLLGKLPPSERAAIQRAMGLKIEQLKAELQQLND